MIRPMHRGTSSLKLTALLAVATLMVRQNIPC